MVDGWLTYAKRSGLLEQQLCNNTDYSKKGAVTGRSRERHYSTCARCAFLNHTINHIN